MKKQNLLALIFFAGISFNGFSQASFTMDVTAGCLPLCSNFTDQTPNATSWLWDFDNTSTSTAQNPTCCYTNPGVYTVTLTATTPNGTSTATGTITVYPTPLASFSSANVPTNTVNFTDQSLGATYWEWDFGDATPSSNLQNPTHTYAAAGNYIVHLMVISAQGCSDSVSSSIIANVIDLENNAASWSIYPNPSNGQASIHFEGIIQNPEMLRIENMLGEVVLEKEISADATIDLSTEASGIYFVRVGNSPAKKLMVR
jgi:PKD repeat protein